MIRTATAADQGAVGALFGAFLTALGYAPNPELDRDMADFPQAYSGPGNTFVVATTAAGEIKAMGGLMAGEIRRLFVHPDFRGQGLAVDLINNLIEFHQRHGTGPLSAVVARDNQAAQAAFRHCGFERSGRTPAHPQSQHCEIWERMQTR